MYYVKLEDKQVLSLTQIRMLYSQVSIPDFANLEHLGYRLVREESKPPVGPNQALIMNAPVAVDGEYTISYSVVDLPVYSVTAAQCRLALYDKYGIASDEDFIQLVDILPDSLKERAILELRTCTVVERDHPLVVAIADAKGWNLDELFSYAATL